MKICEIFASIQGESTYAGLPCAFIRTAGCNLRCSYCDTTYAYDEGAEMSPGDAVRAVGALGVGLVEITGGEPLMQPEVPSLVSALCSSGYNVLVETNGSLSIADIDRRASIIMDVKTPGSGMSEVLDLENLGRLKAEDEIKFVLTGRDDYEWAREFLGRHGAVPTRKVLFSPVFGMLQPRSVAEWILQDRLPVRLNLQLHKYIYGPEERGV
jgi:7-carboxy-7-deazaguanine synthase